MRSLATSLIEEQKKPSFRPALKLEVQEFDHPDKSDSIQWELFGWQQIYSGNENAGYHDACIAGDGSINRIRLDGTTIYHQRKTSPDDLTDFSTGWSNEGNVTSDARVAIGCNGSEVIMVSMSAAYLYRKESGNNGATWGSWIEMSNARPCERGVAIAFKSNGDCAIVHASDVNDPESFYIQTRTSGTWSSGLGQRSGNWEIEGLGMYHDGTQWCIVILWLEGNYLHLVRTTYDGSWGENVKMGLARAHVSMQGAMRDRQFGDSSGPPTYWERRQVVLEALAGQALGVSGVSITKPSGYPCLFSTSRDNVPWLYRMRLGGSFTDDQWDRASQLPTAASYGMAIATDSDYIWMSHYDQVWRCAMPNDWDSPTAGSGAGTKFTVPTERIIDVGEEIRSHAASSLSVTLNNHDGAYDSPGAGDISELKRGSRVNLFLGCEVSGGEELEEVSRYFIERWGYSRSPHNALFNLYCVDAWRLLEQYAFNRPVEWNFSTNDYCVYELIGKVVKSIDGTLSYKSRSSLIQNLYPRLEVSAGQTAASVLMSLLNMVEDVIFFFGLTGYIVHPQAGDSPTYRYKFP